jgi:NAD(P)H-dependent flavin oxidoreductase YrpB (nitropropane dioxygenase family)
LGVAAERFGRIDTLVNNAGVFIAKPFTEYSEKDFATMIAVNLAGFLHLSQKAAASMLRMGSGHIVNITATIAEQPMASSAAALAALTKGGLNAMTRSLAIEYASRHVRVNAAVIAQGYEAGGHRGMFLDCNRNRAVALQIGTMALVPQIVDAVSVPVIADGRRIVAAFALGASGAQIGTGFLLCPEAATSALHRDAMRHAHEHETVVTNVFSGRPARALVNRLACEIGFLADAVSDFPLPLGELGPLRAAAEQKGSRDFTPLRSGQAAAFSREMPAAMLMHITV